MAGDWIKFELATLDKSEVVRMAARLGIDQDAVTGKLLRVWAWADQNTIDGNAVSVTSAFLDRLTVCPGFAKAMQEAGWLEGDELDFTFPNFERHNGITGKKRSETNRRVTNHRAKCNANTVTDALQKALPEKRREEKEEPPTPKPSPSAPERVKRDVLPTTPEAQAVAVLFNRRLNTAWDEKEIRAYKKLISRGVLNADSMSAITDYYAAERQKGEDGRHRRDLKTFLNNFDGELDRAGAFANSGQGAEKVPSAFRVPMQPPPTRPA